MPGTNANVRVYDPVLSGIAQGYANMDFVGGLLFPRVPVKARGGQIVEFGKEAFMRYATRRAPGANTARLQFGYLGKPFALFNDAIDVPVPREHQQDAMTVPGIDIIGTLPAEIGEVLTFSAAIFAAAPQPEPRRSRRHRG